MKCRLLIASFLYTINLFGYLNFQSDRLSSCTSLQNLDIQSRRKYPIKLSKNPIRIIVVPCCSDESARYLTITAYRMLENQNFDKIIIITSLDSTLFYGIALPYNNNLVTDSALCNYSNFLKQASNNKRLFHWHQPSLYTNYIIDNHKAMLAMYTTKTPCLYFLTGQLSDYDAHCLAQNIADYSSLQTLIIFCTDIGTYHNCMHTNPCDQSEICTIYDQDSYKIQALQSYNFKQNRNTFLIKSQESSAFTLLFALLKIPKFKNLKSYFVGYATSKNEGEKKIRTYSSFIFQDNNRSKYKNNIGLYEQQQLLQHARKGINDLFAIPCLRKPYMISFEMIQPHGAFTSLYKMADHGIQLQGCMGKVITSIPLQDMVYQMTQQAACNDTRFYSLKKRDINNTIISLEIITEMEQIKQKKTGAKKCTTHSITFKEE